MRVPEFSSARQQLQAIFRAGLNAVHGAPCVEAYLTRHPVTQPTAIIAIGKAASAMASGALRALGEHAVSGLLVTKTGHVTPDCRRDARLTCIEAGHPLPDARSLNAGTALCRFLDEVPASTGVLFLISGGASSLVEVLPAGIRLEQLQRLNSWLLGSGLDITHMNRMRQSLSLIKGGRLLERLGNRPALALLISDVPGDNPAVIGSGLLYPQAEQPALDIQLPDWLARLPLTTPPPSITGRVPHRIIASLDRALQAAAEYAQTLGYPTMLMPARLAGDAEATGRDIARQLRQLPPGIYLWGGETTVELPERPGRGGRNQHLALAAAGVFSGSQYGVLLAAGTDGTDGPGTAAGALVDSGTWSRIRASGLDPAACLQQADAGTCLAASGDLLHTGPTGTNVMDMVIGFRQETATGGVDAQPV